MIQKEIGERLRARRKERHMNMQELAEKSGVSVGLISQIERGLVAPSVVSLFHIGQVLGVEIGSFFSGSEPAYHLQRKGEHKVIMTNGELDKHIMLGTDRPNRLFDMLILELKGGESYTRECIAHNGEECCYVVSGELTILIDDEEITLYEGDSLYYSSNHPHGYINKSQKDCISFWAMAPKFF